MGLTSRSGVVPLNLLADIAGPMARTVEDAVAVFQVIVGADPDDPATAWTLRSPQFGPRKPPSVPDYAAALKRDGLKGARIGVLRQAYERDTTDPEIVQVFMAAIDDIKRAGATIVDPARWSSADVAAAGRRGVRRVQVRHQPLSGVTGRSRARPQSRRRSSSRGDSIRRSQRRLEQAEEGNENGPETPACKAEAE